jgi:serine/threonine protein phosphatase PrpC
LKVVSDAASPEEAVQRLVDGANAHGGEDNVTAIVARVVED